MTERGQSMFEVVIALFIVAMIIVSVVSLSTISLANSIFSKNKTVSGRLSQEAVEWLRSEKEKNPADFLSYVQNNSVYCLQTPAWSNVGVCSSEEFVTGTIYKRSVTFNIDYIGTCPGVNCKRIIEADVTTSWTDGKGYHETKSVTNFNDIREK